MRSSVSVLVRAFLVSALLAGASRAAGPETSTLDQDPDYRDGVAAINAMDYEKALVIFHRLQPERAAAPEVANWLGFAYRKLKRYPESKRWYDQSLMLDPNYLPALEYQGEWFIETGDMASAKANLAKLERLCGTCHEWQDLDQSIRKAEGK
ncbi:MAG: tetratricopeptide repeat protein [Hyphomicrobiales bacterium]|nr:tetratricopeptide repeat protein [Hyphomicrobiales bacterium]